MIANGQVTINGNTLSETYLNPDIKTGLYSNRFITEQVEITIPYNSYFVMGDNRKHSLDSRETGFIEVKDIIGKIISCEPPVNE